MTDECLEEFHTPLGCGRVSKRHEGFEAANNGFISVGLDGARRHVNLLVGHIDRGCKTRVVRSACHSCGGIHKLATHLYDE